MATPFDKSIGTDRKLLHENEILEYLHTIYSDDVTKELLRAPTPSFVKKIFTCFVQRIDIGGNLHSKFKEIWRQKHLWHDGEGIMDETVVFQVIKCIFDRMRISNFSLVDILSPAPKPLIKQLTALIRLNKIIDENKAKIEKLLIKIAEKQNEDFELQQLRESLIMENNTYTKNCEELLLKKDYLLKEIKENAKTLRENESKLKDITSIFHQFQIKFSQKEAERNYLTIELHDVSNNIEQKMQQIVNSPEKLKIQVDEAKRTENESIQMKNEIIKHLKTVKSDVEKHEALLKEYNDKMNMYENYVEKKKTIDKLQLEIEALKKQSEGNQRQLILLANQNEQKEKLKCQLLDEKLSLENQIHQLVNKVSVQNEAINDSMYVEETDIITKDFHKEISELMKKEEMLQREHNNFTNEFNTVNENILSSFETRKKELPEIDNYRNNWILLIKLFMETSNNVFKKIKEIDSKIYESSNISIFLSPPLIYDKHL